LLTITFIKNNEKFLLSLALNIFLIGFIYRRRNC